MMRNILRNGAYAVFIDIARASLEAFTYSSQAQYGPPRTKGPTVRLRF